MAQFAPRAECKILIGNKDKTADFTPYNLNLTFEDHRAGESDRLTITLEDAPPTPDHTGPGLWLTPDWYPVKGAQVEAWMGYEGAPLLACGAFEIDEITITDGDQGTTVAITALATPNQKPVRTPRSASHDGKTLKEIAQDTAQRHGLTLVGEPPANKLPYTIQKNETDLAFLQRLADAAAAVFTVKGDKLIFHDTVALAKQPPIWKITRHDVSSATFSDKIKETAASYSHFDGDTQALIETSEDGDKDAPPDKIKSRAPVKDQAQQQTAAKAKSRSAKAKGRTASLDGLDGNTSLVAGALVEIAGYGVLDGLWAIETSTHTIDAGGGYTTALELKLP